MSQIQLGSSFRTVAALVAIAAMPWAARAATMTYEMSGTASGSLGSQSFSGAHITFTTTADTAGVTSISAGPVEVWENTGPTTVAIEGIGTALLTGDVFGVYAEDLSVIYSPGVAAGGILDATLLHGVFSEYNPVFAAYHTDTALASVAGPSTTFDAALAYETSAGELIISGTDGDALFQAALASVPEPGSFAAVTGAALGLLALARRRGRFTAIKL